MTVSNVETLSKRLFVVLAGPDCSGKSTLAQLLSSYFNIPVTKGLRMADTHAMVQSIEDIFVTQAPKLTGQGIIMDRWQFPDDIIYEEAHGREESVLLDRMPAYERVSKEANLLILHVTASNKELLRRLAQRGDDEVDAEKVIAIKHLYEAFFTTYDLPVATINSTGLDSIQVFRQAIGIITGFYIGK